MNKEQLRAVKTVTGPVMTIAGPGSGKTTVIVGRVLHMTRDLHITPSSILVVTFTKAAALEMRKRYLLQDGASEKVNFGTFHSVFFHILKQYYGYTDKNILTGARAFGILRSVLGERFDRFAGNDEFLAGILDEIGKSKSRMYFSQNPKSMTLGSKSEDAARGDSGAKHLTADAARGEFRSEYLPADEFRRILTDYNEKLSDLGLIDFEDMLIKTYELLCSDGAALSFWQNKFAYILIDEFQDINDIQYKIVKLLAAPGNNIFIVGDDDQSIYSFRGAKPAIMKAFPKDFPGTMVINLPYNYRSDPEIIRRAHSLIGNNKDRYEKTQEAAREASAKKAPAPPFTVKHFRKSADEYAYIAALIKKELSSGTPPEEIAVLLRTNRQAEYFFRKMNDTGIKFTVKGITHTIFDDRFVVPLLSYLRFVSGENSSENFVRFMNRPVRYIERASVPAGTVNLSDLLSYYKKAGKTYVEKHIKDLSDDLTRLAKLDPKSGISYIRKQMKYELWVKETLGFSPEAVSFATDTLDELAAYAEDFGSYRDFLAFAEEQKEKQISASYDKEADAVQIMTYHGCKGLEFESVYLPDLEEGMTPHRKNSDAAGIEEERRMFYVAMTRAKDRLFLSSSERRLGRDNLKVSRFLGEVMLSDTPPSAGTVVFHSVYKKGTVIKTEGDAIYILFDNLSVPKKLSFRHCVASGMLKY